MERLNQYKIYIKLKIVQERDIDYKNSLSETIMSVLDGQRIVNEEGFGVIQVVEVEVIKLASD